MRYIARSTAGIAWAASHLDSSAHAALGDDALKDFDSAGWVVELPPSIQPVWVQRIRAIRQADRLSEARQLDRAAADDIFLRLPAHFFAADGPRALAAWTGYLAALRAFHRRDLRLSGLADHRAMLDRLSGSLFQLVPFLSPPQFEAIRGLGVLDQFFNNLRDLAEDAAHGICYFPDDVLARARLRRDDVLGDRWRSRPGCRTSCASGWMNISLSWNSALLGSMLATTSTPPWHGCAASVARAISGSCTASVRSASIFAASPKSTGAKCAPARGRTRAADRRVLRPPGGGKEPRHAVDESVRIEWLGDPAARA